MYKPIKTVYLKANLYEIFTEYEYNRLVTRFYEFMLDGITTFYDQMIFLTLTTCVPSQ